MGGLHGLRSTDHTSHSSLSHNNAYTQHKPVKISVLANYLHSHSSSIAVIWCFCWPFRPRTETRAARLIGSPSQTSELNVTFPTHTSLSESPCSSSIAVIWCFCWLLRPRTETRAARLIDAPRRGSGASANGYGLLDDGVTSRQAGVTWESFGLSK